MESYRVGPFMSELYRVEREIEQIQSFYTYITLHRSSLRLLEIKKARYVYAVVLPYEEIFSGAFVVLFT